MDDARIAVMKRVFEGWKARDFDALLALADPQILAELRLPPGEATQSYRGHDEVLAFLRDGDETYELFEAEPRAFAVGSTGRVFAEGSVSYRTRDGGGMTSVAYWVCEIQKRQDRVLGIVFRPPSCLDGRGLAIERLWRKQATGLPRT